MLFEIEFLFPALRSEFIECGAFGQIIKTGTLSVLITLWEGGVKSLDQFWIV